MLFYVLSLGICAGCLWVCLFCYLLCLRDVVGVRLVITYYLFVRLRLIVYDWAFKLCLFMLVLCFRWVGVVVWCRFRFPGWVALGCVVEVRSALFGLVCLLCGLGS